MCGILGVIGRRGGVAAIDASVLARLGHRGPDGSGSVTDHFASLGHTRLAILDTSTAGAQPMLSRSGRFVITFNGEIYNYRELRDHLARRGHRFQTGTDTEVLLALFEEYGPACLAHLRGMFAFAIWDRWNREMFAARDRCGERPFFLFHDHERLIFASELKPLVPLLPSVPRIDPAIVDMYLRFQYVPEPWTLLEGVRKLPAAHSLRLRVDSWQLECRRYWSLEDAPEIDGPVAPRIAEALEEAVRLQLRSDVPVGVALSGGIDSGAIAALAARNSAVPMHAFSVGYPGRPPCDERDEALRLGTRLGMRVHEVEIPVGEFVGRFRGMVDALDEPIADPAAFAHLAVPAAARAAGIKVLLGGIGGDELFWGYGWLRQVPLVNRLRDAVLRMPGGRSAICHTGVSRVARRLLKRGWLPPRLRPAAEAAMFAFASRTPVDQAVYMGCTRDFVEVDPVLAGWGLACGTGAADLPPRYWPTVHATRFAADRLVQAVRLVFDTWLVSNCLSLGDRLGMSCGVEMRQPFLDHRLIETVVGLHRRQAGWAEGHKPWLKEAVRGIVPDEVLDRPKRGFTPPVADWLRGVVRAHGHDLEDGVITDSGILQPAIARRIGGCGEGATWPQLFTAYKLVLLEHWARQVAGLRGAARAAA